MKKTAKKVAKETKVENSKNGLVFGKFDPTNGTGAIAKAIESGKPVKKSVIEKLAKQHKVDGMGRIYRLSRFVKLQKIGRMEITTDTVQLVKGKGKKVA